MESERRIEFTRLQCLLGTVDRQRVQTCANIAEAIDIDWAVLHNGQLAAAGSSKESSGGEYGDPMAREIGHFSAKRGERYSVVLYIHRNGGELSTTNPKLVVETQPWEWADAAEASAIISVLRPIGIAASAIFAIAGLLTLILTPLFGRAYRWHRRRTAVKSASDSP